MPRPVLSQIQIEEDLLQILDDLERLLDDMSSLGEEAAKAEVLYKVAHARSYLGAVGTVKHRDAVADKSTESEHLDHAILSARVKYTREAISTKRARLDVLRSLNSNLRPMVTHGG